MAKKVVIIGAGIAGLSAGCFARMNDYEAEIYESHNLPGGLCTAWKRKQYTIDGCIHWLTGSSPDYSFYKVWQELGAVQGRRMLNHEAFTRLTNKDGRTFTVYCDADKLEKQMLYLSPEDAESIKLLCRLIRRFTKFQIPVGKPFERYTIFDIIPLIIKMLPFSKDMNFCNSITIGEFASRFKDPFLRESLPMLLWEKDYPLLSLVVTFALLHMKDGGFPEGGSLEFARAIEKRFINLGGKIFYKQKVEKILIENGCAVGIRLSDGCEVRGDYVISAADLKTTPYEMLDGKFIDPMHEEMFRTVKLAPSSVQVSFGVNLDLSNQLDCLSDSWELSHPIQIGNRKFNWIFIKNYCFDKTLAPPGKSVVESTFVVDDFQYWENLVKDKVAYSGEKERIAASVAEEIERKYPGFKNAIEVTDIVTPMTYVRYTGNWKGTYMTWVISPDIVKKYRMVKKTVPGLDNFWLSGMWVQPPGGVPTGAMTSRDIIQLMCKKDKKRFRTETPQN
ncbi:MAG: NAD(P)/FAD-dependent oxidoreductase [Dehalococcoidales bacterium]|nr:NAD(P)/FAD-dependent oxidoreductase [Dehalococcoidales bacterium]